MDEPADEEKPQAATCLRRGEGRAETQRAGAIDQPSLVPRETLQTRDNGELCLGSLGLGVVSLGETRSSGARKRLCLLQIISALVLMERVFFFYLVCCSDWNGAGSSAVDGLDLNGKHLGSARPVQ